jgi:hypothetical protein
VQRAEDLAVDVAVADDDRVVPLAAIDPGVAPAAVESM